MAALSQSNEQRYTYGDYAKWPDDERWELIEGEAYALSPSPRFVHQRIFMYLSRELLNYFEDKTCVPMSAPFDVLLPDTNEPNESVNTVVQPDLLVVCDPAKIEEKCVRGAPDLTIEILSESTTNRDLRDKLFLYEKHGVRCYIIVDPWGKTCIMRDLAPNGKYGHPEIFAIGDIMPIRIFPDLNIDLARIFA